MAPRFHSSLAHILFLDLTLQKQSICFVRLPEKKEMHRARKINIFALQPNIREKEKRNDSRFTWLDLAKVESPEKNCMSG